MINPKSRDASLLKFPGETGLFLDFPFVSLMVDDVVMSYADSDHHGRIY